MKKKSDDLDDPYAAFSQALAIKIMGTNSKVHKTVDKTLNIQNKPESEDPNLQLPKSFVKDLAEILADIQAPDIPILFP